MNGWITLVTGGVLLFLFGLIYAIAYSAIVSLPLEKLSALNLELALDTAVKGQMGIARGYVRDFSALGTKQLYHWLVIAHLIGTGLTAMTVSSFFRGLELKKRWRKILSYLFLCGGLLSASGYFIQILGYEFYGWGLSLLGYVWQVVSMSGFMASLVLHAAASPKL